MTDITAFNTPHRPDTTGVRYTLWTTNHDQIAGDLTPCASRLYRWLLQQAAGGVKQTVDLEDFQQSTVCRKRQTGYHIKHIVRSFKELVKAELACVMRWYGHCKRIFDVIVRHTGAVKPIPPLGRKSYQKYGEVLGGLKKFQTEAETAIPPSSIHSLQKTTEQSHPPHPAAVIPKRAKEEEEEEEKEREIARQAMEAMGYEIDISEEDENEGEEIDLETEESAEIDLETEESAEIDLETEESEDLGEGTSSDRAKYEEKLHLIDSVGIRLNAQLKALVRDFTLDQVKNAIAYYLQTKRIKGTKGQIIKRPAGWFTDCLRQNWCATKPMEQTKEEEEFSNWYSQAIASGLVEDLPISWLTKDYNQEFVVRQRKPGLYGAPYTLISWRELQKQATEPNQPE